MDGPINPGSAPQLSPQLDGMTRRHPIARPRRRHHGAGGAAAGGGRRRFGRRRGAGDRRPRGQAVDVTLITTDSIGALPYPGLPTAEQQAADPV